VFCKEKSNVVPVHAMKALGRGRCIALLTVNLGTRSEWSVSRLMRFIQRKEGLLSIDRDRGAEILGTRWPTLVNSVRWRLIFVGPRYRTCFISSNWRLEFWGGSEVLLASIRRLDGTQGRSRGVKEQNCFALSCNRTKIPRTSRPLAYSPHRVPYPFICFSNDWFERVSYTETRT
jgi:hypothetical protein